MNHFRLPIYALLMAALVLTTGCLRKRDHIQSRKDELVTSEAPIQRDALKESGKLYFVPLGDFPADIAAELANYYREKYQLEIEILPRVPLSEAEVNRKREQLIAEQLIAIMKQTNPQITNDPEAVMIGLTDQDMYVNQMSWQFAFSWRVERKYAVVSSARMFIPVKRRWKITERQMIKRMRKMVTKNVLILYYHLAPNDDPRSVLYRNVGGIRDLDYMREDI